MNRFILAIFTLLTFAACGGPDNVAACNALVSKLKCGAFDLSGVLTCDSYANVDCDIAPYFDCLSNAYVCTNDMFTPESVQNANACVSKASCE